MSPSPADGGFLTCPDRNEHGFCSKRGGIVSQGVCRSCCGIDVPAPRPLPEPSLSEMGANLSEALAEWARAGFTVASMVEISRRREICLACEHWRPLARMGLGKCLICGCCRFKWWLASEQCPLGKWSKTVDIPSQI